jgi:hypothetical protein
LTKGERFNELDDPESIQLMERMNKEDTHRSSADTKKYLEEAYIRLNKMFADFKIPKDVEKK